MPKRIVDAVKGGAAKLTKAAKKKLQEKADEHEARGGDTVQSTAKRIQKRKEEINKHAEYADKEQKRLFRTPGLRTPGHGD